MAVKKMLSRFRGAGRLSGGPRGGRSNNPRALKSARQSLTSKVDMGADIGRSVGLIKQVQGTDEQAQALGHLFE